MEKAKEILWLSQMGLSQREVAGGTGCSLGTVNAVLARVKEAGIKEPLGLTTKELGSIIYPAGKDRQKAEPDFEHIDLEMKKKGTTLFLLWEEYKVEHPQGIMYSQFCAHYRKWRKKNSVYLRKVYKAGERMLVDWAGLTMRYREGGSEKKAYMFVAVLPASSFLYAHPFGDMKMESWIGGHVGAFEYFGGIPRLLVPDNAKTAVAKASRYEAELNRTYREMAEHYGAAVVPARPSSPKDKAPVETGVQIVERRIIAKLRHCQFMGLEELQEAVHVELESLNDRPFQKLPGSRRSVFMAAEKHELAALPSRRYEYARFKQAKAGFDYHVALDRDHYYSVPYQHAGKQVLIRWTPHTVEVFLDGERIACHVRSMDPRKRFVTEPSHMPESHRAVTDWSPQRFMSWAAKTGIKTKEYITLLLERREHPEQAFRTCAGILRIASTVTVQRMEEACAMAMAHNVYSYSCFAKLLENRKPKEPLIHGNLRGKDYFGEPDHV